MTYTEQIKSILEKSGVDTSALPDNLYSTLLNALLNAEMGGGGLTREEVEKIVTDEVAKIVADAPEDFDTLKEMSDWISQHEDSAAAMNSAIQQNATDISTLKNDSHTHTNKTVLDGITQVQLDKITTNETNISTLKKHMVGELTDSDFQEDSTAVMTKTVPSGMSDYAAISKISGKTQKMVQLVSKQLASAYNVTLNSSSATYSNAIAYRKGHVYMMSAKSNAYPIRFQCDEKYGMCKIEVGSNTRYLSKFTCNYSDFSSGSFIYNPSSSSYTVTGNFLIFDLTEMGIPDITVKNFKAMFPEEYYAPTMGELWNAPVESVVSTSADGTTKTTLLIPEAIKNLPDYGVGIDSEHCNWIDFENMVYHHNYTSADLTGKGWTSDGGGVFHTSYPTNAKVNAYGICNNYTVYYNRNTPQNVGDMIVRDPTYNVMYVKVESGTSPDTTGVILYYELDDTKKELIDISDILHPIRVETGGTITFTNEHNLDMPNTVVYKKEVSLNG